MPANLRYCLFQYRVRAVEKYFLTTISTKVTSCVFAPFVAIPGKRPAAEFCKRLMKKDSSGLLRRGYALLDPPAQVSPAQPAGNQGTCRRQAIVQQGSPVGLVDRLLD